MENKEEIRINTIRNVDPHMVHITGSAARTALYSYEQEGESWSKPEVEGTLMLYSREAPPHNMMIIINRLNKSNFIEPLTSSCDIQVKPPYLLFRNCKGEIYGIWFSQEEDVHRISSAIKDKISQDSQPAPQPAPNIMNDPAVGLAFGGSDGGDIMSMLSRAHGVFESKRQEPTRIVTTVTNSSNDLVKPSPVRASECNTTNTVADFFAKAGMSGIGGSGGALHSPSSAASSGVSSTTTNTTNPVLQKLFQGAAAVGGQASVSVSVCPGISAPIAIPGAPLQTRNVHSSSSVPPSAPMSLQELEGKLKENLHISSSKDDQQFFKSPTQPAGSSLLSPQVFTSTRPQGRDIKGAGDTNTCTYPSLLTSVPCLGVDIRPLNGSHESLQEGVLQHFQSQSSITPLTQEQLVQAFSILLKRDDFVHQLHQAYVQALNQSLKGCL